jgi:hypothetical protein
VAKVDTESPALRTLRTRLRTSLQHLELVDAALSLVEATGQKAADRKQPLPKALGVPGKYETLTAPAQQAGSLCNFSRGENLELALLAFHVHFLEYLRTVLADIHQRHPLPLLTGAESEVSWERIVQRFEGRGGADELIGRILEATGIDLDPDAGRQAHAYLAMRDLYVYNGGLVDEEFARLHGDLWNVQPGHKLPRNLKIGRTAAHAIERLATELDAKLGALPPPPRA